LNHVTKGRPPFTVEKKGRIEKEYLIPEERNGDKVKTINPSEQVLYVHDNELIKGMIDKAQFGNYGIVHTVHELYGPETAGVLLSSFSRLFTMVLQLHGFTCGVDDLLLSQESDMTREEILGKSEKHSKIVHINFTRPKKDDKAEAKAEDIRPKEGDEAEDTRPKEGDEAEDTRPKEDHEAEDSTHPKEDHEAEGDDEDQMKLQMEVEKIIRRNGESATVILDRNMSSELNTLTSKVNKKVFPYGLRKPFPGNCLSLMTQTGAKGGLVNMTQISSLLGQQELEGKRVPRMISGKTLPCFPPWDTSSRAGGFIGDRFLTGLRPQEYYFHCMAGREGLVDTAVKTSRSGYLQRCLIKSLESLKVSYDHTVRDVDGSIIQFCYGEDGVDVLKTSFLDDKFRELSDVKH
jgi:DNA-directed RNA polymerase I subunit RPA1